MAIPHKRDWAFYAILLDYWASACISKEKPGITLINWKLTTENVLAVANVSWHVLWKI